MPELNMPLKVFFSYSHQDKALRDELESHLSLLRREGLITTWHDREIEAGQEWQREIDDRLGTADIVLLLVSPPFIDSSYCWSFETEIALKRHQRGEARVIPIILRPVDWKSSPLGVLQVLPKGAKPVVEWALRDSAFLEIASELRKVITTLVASRLSAAAALGQPNPQVKDDRFVKADVSSGASSPVQPQPLLYLPPSIRVSTREQEPHSTATQPDPTARVARVWRDHRRPLSWLVSWFLATAIAFAFRPAIFGMMITITSGTLLSTLLSHAAVQDFLMIALPGILQWAVIAIFFRHSLSVLRMTLWIAVMTAFAATSAVPQEILRNEYVLLAWLALGMLVGRLATFPDQRDLAQFRSWRVVLLLLPFALFPIALELVGPWSGVLFTLAIVSMIMAPAIELLRSLPRPERRRELLVQCRAAPGESPSSVQRH
ncbi:MAG: toll/interleukin-1 receptor domain-containing protein [Acidobacteria bacterium]|nr:toll/interleukin-1 receptor domain-containing protein [Acidobacteriota bacterium]